MAGEQERTGPDAEPGTARLVGRSIEEFASQLKAFADRARSVAGAVPGRLPLPALPSPPGALSAAQLRAVAQTVHAQRQSIAAMRAQLDAFDEQLGVVERVLDPLVEWSATWSRLEEAVGDLVRPDDRRAARPPQDEPPAQQPSGQQPSPQHPSGQ